MIRETAWMVRRARRRSRGALRTAAGAARDWRRFWGDYRRYAAAAPPDARPSLLNLYPCLGDATDETPVDPTYFYQDAWAFKKIVERRPERHLDIGSHHKFVALLSTVVPTTMVDVRPLPLPLDSLEFVEGSLLELPFADASEPSVSSLCVVEHVGLGRYGDPIDPHGTEKAIAELKRVVAPGGDLYVSVPIDVANTVYFNAHRAFAEEYLLELFAPFEVAERRYVHGREFREERLPRFGTGCYHLVKPR